MPVDKITSFKFRILIFTPLWWMPIFGFCGFLPRVSFATLALVSTTAFEFFVITVLLFYHVKGLKKVHFSKDKANSRKWIHIELAVCQHVSVAIALLGAIEVLLVTRYPIGSSKFFTLFWGTHFLQVMSLIYVAWSLLRESIKTLSALTI